MEYVGFVFGVFGLMAFLQVSSLKRRVDLLEEELAKMEGTPAFEKRKALVEAAGNYIGEKVILELKEDHEDVDITMYGNKKYGSNTIVDVDDDWMLVHIESKKGSKDKLIRLASIERINLAYDQNK